MLLILPLLVPLILAAGEERFAGEVVAVTDGDTIKVLRGGKEVRFRLQGIDCPEKHQAFGAQAKQLSSDLAFRQTVSVHVQGQDRYGRIVGEVFLPDGRSLNRELVRAGLAWWYQRYAPKDHELEKLEAEARKARRRLWQDMAPVSPWEFRKIRSC